MCNLYANLMPQDAMRSLFDVAAAADHLGNAEPLPAIFPKYDAPVVVLEENGGRALRRMHWGFVMPQKSKKTGKPIQPKAVNNARDDKIRTSGFWKRHFEHRRCLIPATSFCEAKGRQPADYHWFGVDDRSPFVFAGFWMRYKGPWKDETVDLDTLTMVTSSPNAVVRPVHPDRMPVILDREDYAAWLTAPPDDAAVLLKPFPAERMTVIDHGEDLRAEPPNFRQIETR